MSDKLTKTPIVKVSDLTSGDIVTQTIQGQRRAVEVLLSTGTEALIVASKTEEKFWVDDHTIESAQLSRPSKKQVED